MLGRVALLLLSSLLTSTLCSEWQSVPRIMGGDTVENIEEFPWMLSVQRWGAYTCGASIIGSRWSLTAAHCVSGISGLAEVTLRAGTTWRELGGWVIGVNSIQAHPQANQWRNDIAVLHVQSDFPFGDKIKAVTVAKASLEVGSTPDVTGWGRTSSTESISWFLQKTTVVVISRYKCKEEFDFEFEADIFCARPARSFTDICEGVAGGPLTKDGTQYGIAVYGRCLGNVKKSSMYVNIPHFHDWINQVIADSPKL